MARCRWAGVIPCGGGAGPAAHVFGALAQSMKGDGGDDTAAGRPPSLAPALPSCPQDAIYGNFSAAKVQEIVVSRGRVLELLRPDETGKVQVIHSTDVFGIIRSLAPFRCLLKH